MKTASTTLHYWTMKVMACAILAQLATGTANATENLTIQVDSVRVFTSPSLSSPVITILKKGQSVPAGVNPGAGFKKVLVQDATGKKIIGYVALVDLTPPIFGSGPDGGPAKIKKGHKKEKPLKGNNLGLRRHYALGVNLGFNYQYQGSKTITDPIGDSVSVTGLSGTNLVIGLLFDIPLSPTFTLEVDATYKPSSLTGTGTDVGTTSPSTIVNLQTSYGLGVIAKWYAGVSSDWWYGPGIEYDLANSGSLNIGAKPLYSYPSSSLTNYVLLFAATGYDFSSSKNFYITPSFRLGAAVNGNPTIIEFDMIVSGSYRF